MIHHGGRGPLSSECDCADGEPGSFCRHSGGSGPVLPGGVGRMTKETGAKRATAADREWEQAGRRHRLSPRHIQMARQLGLNPKKLGSLKPSPGALEGAAAAVHRTPLRQALRPHGSGRQSTPWTAPRDHVEKTARSHDQDWLSPNPQDNTEFPVRPRPRCADRGRHASRGRAFREAASWNGHGGRHQPSLPVRPGCASRPTLRLGTASGELGRLLGWRQRTGGGPWPSRCKPSPCPLARIGRQILPRCRRKSERGAARRQVRRPRRLRVMMDRRTGSAPRHKARLRVLPARPPRVTI